MDGVSDRLRNNAGLCFLRATLRPASVTAQLSQPINSFHRSRNSSSSRPEADHSLVFGHSSMARNILGGFATQLILYQRPTVGRSKVSRLTAISIGRRDSILIQNPHTLFTDTLRLLTLGDHHSGRPQRSKRMIGKKNEITT